MIDISYIKQLLSKFLVFSVSNMEERECILEFENHEDALEGLSLLSEYKQQGIIDCYIITIDYVVVECFKLIIKII